MDKSIPWRPGKSANWDGMHKKEVSRDGNEFRRMIADYMENGYLENIIAMFKWDSSLYSMVGELLKDERLRVRIGIIALMEELKKKKPDEVKLAIPSLLPLLKDGNPIIRGDAAWLLGYIGGKETLHELEPLLDDSDPNVAKVTREFFKDK